MEHTPIVHCNHCGSAMSVTEDYLARYGGQMTTCPACGQAVVIPAPTVPSAMGEELPPGVAPMGPRPIVLGYATPRSQGHGLIGFDGRSLVMAKNLIGPDRCVKCNAPAQGYRLHRRLSWHPAGLFLLIVFPGLIIYAIVALCVRKTAQVSVGLCPVHRAARRRNIAIAWFLSLLGLGLMIAVPALLADVRGPDAYAYKVMGVLGGVAVLLIGLIFGAAGAPVVSPRRIDDRYVYLRGAGRAFLESLPRT